MIPFQDFELNNYLSHNITLTVRSGNIRKSLINGISLKGLFRKAGDYFWVSLSVMINI
jgi:hypothetical protein